MGVWGGGEGFNLAVDGPWFSMLACADMVVAGNTQTRQGDGNNMKVGALSKSVLRIAPDLLRGGRTNAKEQRSVIRRVGGSRRIKAWPYRQECRGHDPTKKNLFY